MKKKERLHVLGTYLGTTCSTIVSSTVRTSYVVGPSLSRALSSRGVSRVSRVEQSRAGVGAMPPLLLGATHRPTAPQQAIRLLLVPPTATIYKLVAGTTVPGTTHGGAI